MTGVGGMGEDIAVVVIVLWVAVPDPVVVGGEGREYKSLQGVPPW